MKKHNTTFTVLYTGKRPDYLKVSGLTKKEIKYLRKLSIIEKDRILKDCIENPGKYLKEDEK